MHNNKKGRQKAAPKSHTPNHSAKPPLHGMTPIEEGQTVGDILPAFAGVTNEIHIGTPNPECASCRKPFNAVRKRRKAVRLYPTFTAFPMAFSFDICGHCLALYEQGASARDGVLAAVESYCEGEEFKQ